MAHRMFTLIGATLGALLLFAVGVAYAASGPGEGVRLHGLMDRADGAKHGASLRETKATSDMPLNRLDRHGMITKDEFNRVAHERLGWSHLNDDGKFAKGELPRFARRMFA